MNDEAAFDLKLVIDRCLAGQQAAVSELVRHYHSLVFGLCFRMLGQRQDAEDATQETFFRVLRNLSQWDSSRRFEPWLLTIAGNRCRTRLAKRMRRPTVALSEHPLDSAVDLPPAGSILEEVQVAMTRLRDEYRAVFTMFHIEHRTYEEIAVELDVPYGTVKTWCHRARRDLAEVLQRRGNMALPIADDL